MECYVFENNTKDLIIFLYIGVRPSKKKKQKKKIAYFVIDMLNISFN